MPNYGWETFSFWECLLLPPAGYRYHLSGNGDTDLCSGDPLHSLFILEFWVLGGASTHLWNMEWVGARLPYCLALPPGRCCCSLLLSILPIVLPPPLIGMISGLYVDSSMPGNIPFRCHSWVPATTHHARALLSRWWSAILARTNYRYSWKYLIHSFLPYLDGRMPLGGK